MGCILHFRCHARSQTGLEETLIGPDSHETGQAPHGHPFGEWGGKRTQLLERGVRFDFQYILPTGTPPWKPEHGLEFNSPLDPLPMLLIQPVVQYYANVGGRTQHAVVFGFRAKVEF
jgi:carbohydrate-selective porin OprB